MPAHKTKGRKRPHLVPLPRQAIEILGALKGRHGDGPLFPARGGAAGELIGLASVSRCAARLECCQPFQPRDLRRTWKSRAHDAGVDRFTRDLIQQHAGSDTGSKHYDRADYLPQMRDGMAKWEAWLAGVLADISPPAFPTVNISCNNLHVSAEIPPNDRIRNTTTTPP